MKLIEPDTDIVDGTTRELPFIVALASLIEEGGKAPINVFEFGTFIGRTSANIANNLLHPDSRVYTIDLPDGQVPSVSVPDDQKYFHAPVLPQYIHPKVHYLKGDTALYCFDAMHGLMDFVFIDGGHSFNAVLRDSITAFNLIRAGGVILWHDYSDQWPESRDAIRSLMKAGRRITHIPRTPLCLYVETIWQS